MKGLVRILFGLLILFGTVSAAVADPTMTTVEMLAWGVAGTLLTLWGANAMTKADIT